MKGHHHPLRKPPRIGRLNNIKRRPKFYMTKKLFPHPSICPGRPPCSVEPRSPLGSSTGASSVLWHHPLRLRVSAYRSEAKIPLLRGLACPVKTAFSFHRGFPGGTFRGGGTPDSRLLPYTSFFISLSVQQLISFLLQPKGIKPQCTFDLIVQLTTEHPPQPDIYRMTPIRD